MLAEIRAQGGEVYGITSEPHSLAAEAEAAWDMDIPVIGDPHHEIKQDLKNRGWIDVFANPDAGHLRHRSWASHPNGYFQPATIAIHNTHRVLYRWRCVPKYSNMSGAGARPDADYVWANVQTALKTNLDAPLDKSPKLGSETLSWFRFLLILTGHGWFFRPRAFPLLRDGSKDTVTPAIAMRRWYVVVCLWLVALVTLPIIWVSVATIVWALAMVPGLLEIHKQFQNEPDPF